MKNALRFISLLMLLLAPGFLLAQESAVVEVADQVVAVTASADSGNTAWMLTATVLVLFITLPGLALFYGGLVRAQNVLSVLMHCFAIACLASVLLVGVLYSIAFADGSSWVGGL